MSQVHHPDSSFGKKEWGGNDRAGREKKRKEGMPPALEGVLVVVSFVQGMMLLLAK